MVIVSFFVCFVVIVFFFLCQEMNKLPIVQPASGFLISVKLFFAVTKLALGCHFKDNQM